MLGTPVTRLYEKAVFLLMTTAAGFGPHVVSTERLCFITFGPRYF